MSPEDIGYRLSLPVTIHPPASPSCPTTQGGRGSSRQDRTRQRRGVSSSPWPDDGAHYRQTSLCGRPTAPLEGTNSRETRGSPYPDSCPDTEGPSMPGLPSSQRTTEAQLSASPGKVLLMVSGLSPSAHDTALLPSVKEAALWTQAAHSLGDLSPHQQWRHPPTPTTIPQQCQLKGHPELSSGICQFSQVTCTLPGTSFPPSP